MARITICFALALLAVFAGCKRKEPPEQAGTASPNTSALPRVAVLTFEEVSDRAPGGLPLHVHQIDRLVIELRKRGLLVDHFLVEADLDEPTIPASFDAGIVVDTPSFRPSEIRMLERFAQDGGHLIIMGPAAGAAILAGVEPLGETPVARHGDSRVVKSGPPLNASEGALFDWGDAARLRWPVRSAGAEVLLADEDGAPALTRRRIGDGVVWYSAVLPPGRMFEGWAGASPSIDLVETLLKSATARHRAAEAPRATATLAVNPLAYPEGGGPARGILRIRGNLEKTAEFLRYEIRGPAGEIAQSGTLVALNPQWRSAFYAVDFSTLPAGSYSVRIDTHPRIERTIALDGAELDRRIEEELLRWMQSLDLRIPESADALNSEEIESLSHLAWGLARAMETGRAPEPYRWILEQLAYRLRAAAGAVIQNSASTPAQLAAVSAGLARALEPIRTEISIQLARELQVLAEQAYAVLASRRGDDTATVAARLWAAAELHRTTRIDDYRSDARVSARVLFGRQLDRGRSVEGDLYGEFFTDASKTTLLSPDGSRIAAAYALLGLIALERLEEPGTFKTDLATVIDRYVQGVLINGAALNPYGAVPAGLEAAEPPRPRPDGRGLLPPDKIRARAYPLEVDTVPGVEALRLAFAVAALERGRDLKDPKLFDLARSQLNHLLGVNPESKMLWVEGRVLNGVLGRGPEAIPVWRPAYSEFGAALPGNAWLAALHAMLREPQL